MALYTHFCSVSSVLCTQKVREELKSTPEVPQDQGQSSEQNLGQSQHFFSSAHLSQESKQFVSFQGPAHPSNVWVGSASACSPQAYCSGWDLPPRQSNPWTWPWKRPSSSGSWHQGGAGGSDLTLGRLGPGSPVLPTIPTFEKWRTLGSNNALRPQCHFPLSFVGEEPGAGGDQ